MLHFVKAVYRSRSDYDNNSASCDDDYQDDCSDDEGVIFQGRAYLCVINSRVCVCISVSVDVRERESEQMVVAESDLTH